MGSGSDTMIVVVERGRRPGPGSQFQLLHPGSVVSRRHSEGHLGRSRLHNTNVALGKVASGTGGKLALGTASGLGEREGKRGGMAGVGWGKEKAVDGSAPLAEAASR